MRRWLFFAYGVLSHLLFLAVYACMAGFVGNLFVPKSIDSPTDASMASALTIDVLLLVLFGVQHSVMARPAFKRVWTRIVPEPIERATYVLMSCVVTVVLMWQWRAIDGVVWSAEHALLRGVMWALFAAGWLLVPLVSLMINHFDLFGTRQVWLHLRGREYEALEFRTPYLYKHMRHPLYVGWMIAFWATPTMTIGHLVFAAVLTGYMILAAAVFEERDLVAYFGDKYESYRRRVPMFVPRWNTEGTTAPQNTTSADSQSLPA
jgi:methanethiol S-methyltransferase